MGEREKVSAKDATYSLREQVDYSAGSPEMAANDSAEIPYRNWLQAYIRSHVEIPRVEAIAAGAEIVGVSTTATRRYLEKLVSLAGPLTKYKNESRKWMIKAKEGRIYAPERGGWVKLTASVDTE